MNVVAVYLRLSMEDRTSNGNETAKGGSIAGRKNAPGKGREDESNSISNQRLLIHSYIERDAELREYDRKGIENAGEQGVYLKECYDQVKALMSNFDMQLLKQDIFCSLYINLLFELLAYKQIVETDESKDIRNKQVLIKYLEETVNKLSEKKDENAVFFSEALNEIQEYEQCLTQCKMFPNSLPVSDSAYVAYKEIEYGSSSYHEILNLIRKSALERKYSFVLKYIDIGGLKLASGERALLNFFSWLYIVPYFKCIDSSLQTSLRENILVLIDEIDLYCHPLWQQKLIYYLIEETKALFSEKRVQIVFTTHSPIVLSDMPQYNVIYLRRKNGRCVLEDIWSKYIQIVQ